LSKALILQTNLPQKQYCNKINKNKNIQKRKEKKTDSVHTTTGTHFKYLPSIFFSAALISPPPFSPLVTPPYFGLSGSSWSCVFRSTLESKRVPELSEDLLLSKKFPEHFSKLHLEQVRIFSILLKEILFCLVG
jgi:hypothetical protein